ncbi:hypothetical protein KHP11_29125 [Rhodococcus erythropolis]|uniref:hypothetical protein n=1 Tax=Rhodococcus erythropolis TaxID=1833 RepID=UPI0013013F4E|nr:hypothetical protein [Rhodococcus erythropolis]MBT1258521.1 hypothetical protein [Rhodococcus erythropolis]
MSDPYEIALGVLNSKYGMSHPVKIAVVERAAVLPGTMQQPITGNFDFEHFKRFTN